jgi:hypothetical protein
MIFADNIIFIAVIVVAVSFAVCLFEYLFILTKYSFKYIRSFTVISCDRPRFKLVYSEINKHSTDIIICIHLFILSITWIVVDYALLDGSRRLLVPILVSVIYYFTEKTLFRGIFLIMRPFEFVFSVVLENVLKSVESVKRAIVKLYENKKT